MKKTIILASMLLASTVSAIAVTCARSKAVNEADKNGSLSGNHVTAGTDANGNPYPAYCEQTWCPPYHEGQCQEDSKSSNQCEATTTYKPCKSYAVIGNSCVSGPNNADTSAGHPGVTDNGTVGDVKIKLTECRTL